jgi:hypothetical protein
LDAVSRRLLKAGWAAGAGPAPGAAVTMDVDSSIFQVYGQAKQGASRGYTGVRGYHPLLATCAGDVHGHGDRQLLHVRLREGKAFTARGAASFITEALNRLRAAMPVHPVFGRGQVTMRADSGFYNRKVIRACRKAGARFSITVRQNPSIARAIAQIPEQAWAPIPYWSTDTEAFGVDEHGQPVSGADVAEIPYTCFAGSKDATQVRLIVRRVRPTPGTQLELITAFSYHAFVTDRPGDLLSLEADHRAHAKVEQVIADLKGGCGLAHLPSGSFNANAAWLALCAIAYQLARFAAALAGPGWRTATTETLRRWLVAIPARLVHSARRFHLRMPVNWPYRDDFTQLRRTIQTLPAPG